MGGAVGGILGGVGSIIGASSAGDAADAQSAAAGQSLKLQKEMYDQTRADLAPYRDVGNAGWYKLAQLMGLYNPNATSSSKTLIGGNLPSATATTNASGQQVLRGAGGDITILSEKDDGSKRIRTPYGVMWVGADGMPRGQGKIGKAETWLMTQGGLNGFSNANASASAGTMADQTPPSDFGSLLQKFDNSVFEKDPGYQFRMDEGNKALNNSLAAKGGLLSGAAAKAATRYNQDYASNEYNTAYGRFNADQTNLYNRLMGFADKGQSAAAGSAGANNQYADAATDLYTGIGSAKANAAVNQGYFANQGLGTLMNTFGGSSYGGGLYGGGSTNTNSPYGVINWF